MTHVKHVHKRLDVLAALGLFPALFLTSTLVIAQDQPAPEQKAPVVFGTTQVVDSPAATQPGQSPESKPAAKVSPSSPEAIELLEKIEAKTAEVNQLACKVVYTRSQELLGDKQVRLGSLVFLRKPGPARFSLKFTKVIVDDREESEVRHYIYDGQWIVESLPGKKQFFKRQVVNPNDPPQEDLLESGKGPFIIPLTTRKDQILSRFIVTKVPSRPKDPDFTYHLKLEPKPGTRTDYTQIDIWYDTTSLLPRKVRAVDDSQNVSEILLQELKVNLAIDAFLLDTNPPTEPGWLIEITPWDALKAGGGKKPDTKKADTLAPESKK